MYCLDEEDGGHGGKAKSTVHGAEGSGSVLLVAALLSGLAALSAWVHKLALADVGALDELLVLEGLVEAARGSNVVRRLEVESTGDVVKSWSFNPVMY
jgi:hypothetical protein